jgi:hypothetical protein
MSYKNIGIEVTRDYIEEAQQEARLRFGHDLSPAELAEQFGGHDLEARVFHLKNLKNDGELSPREAARRMGYERALKNTHEMLRRAGR